MTSFTDTAGRTWTITINVDAIKRVRALLDVDLLTIVDGQLIERLLRDPVLLCDVVYAVCKPEADAKNITDEQFGQAMAGDAIEHATKALLEELVGFSPSPRDRATLQRVLTTTYQVLDRARDAIDAKLESGELERIVSTALERAGSLSGSAPASAGSTPDR